MQNINDIAYGYQVFLQRLGLKYDENSHPYIEYIDAVGRQGTMSGAARELFITSAALNQQLLKLERELGIQLFVRAKHKLIPTEAGEICLRGIRNMPDIWDATQAELLDVSGSVKGSFKMD